MAYEKPPGPDSGWPDFLFVVGGFLGVVAIGITLLGVSLPHGLKFVLLTIVGMLTALCIGLVGSRGR